MQNSKFSEKKPKTYFSVRRPRFEFYVDTDTESQPVPSKKVDELEVHLPKIDAVEDDNESLSESLHDILDKLKTRTKESKELHEEEPSIEYTDDSSDGEWQYLAMNVSSIASFDMEKTTDKLDLDPNEDVLASSGHPSDFESRGYPQMFPELCKKVTDQEQEASKKLSAKEKAKLLAAELDALYSTSSGSRSLSSLSLPPQSKGKSSKPTPQRLSMYESRYNFDYLDLATLSSDQVENMNEGERRKVVNAFYESNPRHRFKDNYPFMVEGMFQKDYLNNGLKVYTSRLGTIKIPDTRRPEDMSMDYVYFVAIRPGVFGGFWYDIHPISLTSAKFKSQSDTIINGFAILAHPIGSREQNSQEDRWICWNDSLGLMNVNKRAALLTTKKHPQWDMQLDIVAFDAKYQMGSFTVVKIIALTNGREKRNHFPQEIFLLTDAVFKELRMGLAVFYSNTIKSEIVIGKDRIGNVDEGFPYEIVVVPSFLQPNKVQFRVLLIMQSTFWTTKNHWIRDVLSERTDAYRV